MVESHKKKAFVKVVLLGEMNIGKTTLINKFTQNFESSKATFGLDFKQKLISVDNTDLTMEMWDTAGQERYPSICFAFYRDCNSCILTFDVSNQRTFDRLAFWKKNFLDKAQQSNASQFPFVVCGNKTDQERVVSEEQARAWCEINGGYDYFETNAISGEGVDELFVTIGKNFVAKIDEGFMPHSLSGAQGAIKIDANSEKIAEQEKKKKKKKCKC